MRRVPPQALVWCQGPRKPTYGLWGGAVSAERLGVRGWSWQVVRSEWLVQIAFS